MLVHGLIHLNAKKWFGRPNARCSDSSSKQWGNTRSETTRATTKKTRKTMKEMKMGWPQNQKKEAQAYGTIKTAAFLLKATLTTAQAVLRKKKTGLNTSKGAQKKLKKMRTYNINWWIETQRKLKCCFAVKIASHIEERWNKKAARWNPSLSSTTRTQERTEVLEDQQKDGKTTSTNSSEWKKHKSQKEMTWRTTTHW